MAQLIQLPFQTFRPGVSLLDQLFKMLDMIAHPGDNLVGGPLHFPLHTPGCRLNIFSAVSCSFIFWPYLIAEDDHDQSA